MNKISMRHLRYFVALAQYGHFGHAADACSISQPALSVQIKDLEEILGTALIERSARNIRLTPTGILFEKRASEILQAVNDLADLTRTAHRPMTGRLRIGVIPTIAPYVLPWLIRELARDYPDLDLRPHEAVTQSLVADLNDGRLDMAILALPMGQSNLTETPLFDEEFVLVRPLSDANKPVPNADMLREMRLLLLSEGHCFRDQALSYCNLSPTLQRELMEGSSLTTLVQMVGAGIGVTLIPEMAVSIETRSAEVSIARLSDPQPSRTIGALWRKTTPIAKDLEKLCEVLRRFRKA